MGISESLYLIVEKIMFAKNAKKIVMKIVLVGRLAKVVKILNGKDGRIRLMNVKFVIVKKKLMKKINIYVKINM